MPITYRRSLNRFFDKLITFPLQNKINKESVATYISQQMHRFPTSSTLDLSQYNWQIRMESCSLRESPFVKALEEHCSHVKNVDISGHHDIENLEFSRFRKCLPKLETITLKNIDPDSFQISTDQIMKYYANNIMLHADPMLMHHITRETKQFLIENGQKAYAHSIQSGVTPDNLDPERFQQAFETIKFKNEESYRISKIVSNTRKEKLKDLKLKFWNDYLMGHGLEENLWYIHGPKSVDDLRKYGFDETDLADTCYTDTLLMLYAVITTENCWSSILAGPGKQGFMFSSPTAIVNKVESHPAIQALLSDHSGASFALCMRAIERIAQANIFLSIGNGACNSLR